MELLYRIGIGFYRFGLELSSLWNAKAYKWKEGRKDLLVDLKKIDFQSQDWIWFHCASLGEFEQGLPLLQNLKANADYQILLTFFSPSGYEKKKDFELADYVTYMPLDTNINAKEFIQIVKPKFAIFIRYEFWFYHLKELYLNQIPIYLVSGSFNQNQLFFKPLIGRWFRRMLGFYKMIYTIDNDSVTLLNSFQIDNCKQVGDTRADRVLSILNSNTELDKIRNFKGTNKLIVGGSIWLSDLEVLGKSLNQFKTGVKWIIAPHEVHHSNISRIEQFLLSIDHINSVSRYSDFIDSESDVLIIDNIGLLSTIYKYADLVYIGGGFGKGIHNVLEPAVFGTPVVFGKNCYKFPEALGLVDNKGGFIIHDEMNCFDTLCKLIEDDSYNDKISINSKKYVKQLGGATEIIAHEILTNLRN